MHLTDPSLTRWLWFAMYTGRLKLGGFGLSRRLSDINKNPVINLPPVSIPLPAGEAEVLSPCWGVVHKTPSLNSAHMAFVFPPSSL